MGLHSIPIPCIEILSTLFSPNFLPQQMQEIGASRGSLLDIKHTIVTLINFVVNADSVS